LRLDKGEIVSRARLLTERHPDASENKLALKTSRAMARRAAAIGVVAASPALIPGIGTAISIIGILPEEIYLMQKQCEMVLQIAALYGFELESDERLFEIITLAANPVKAIDVFMIAKYDLRRMAAKAAVQLGSRSARAGGIGARAAGRGAVRRLPAVGFLAGGVINYFSFASLGKKAASFYEEKYRLSEDAEPPSKN
jgi:hypothetical protein